MQLQPAVLTSALPIPLMQQALDYIVRPKPVWRPILGKGNTKIYLHFAPLCHCTVCMAVQGREHSISLKAKPIRDLVYKTSTGSLQCMGFRESPTKCLTFIANWVGGSVFITNRLSRDEMWLYRETDTHADTPTNTVTTMTLTGHAQQWIMTG